MIIEGDRVTRFAAHLPLSTNFGALAGVGTRHSAALGLAELTDALCLVVSEERGQISVARDGGLRRLADPGELTAEIAALPAETRPSDGERRSFCASSCASTGPRRSRRWSSSRRSGRRACRARVRSSARSPCRCTSPTCRPTLVLDDVKPAEIDVTLSGLRREF